MGCKQVEYKPFKIKRLAPSIAAFRQTAAKRHLLDYT